MYLEHFGLQEAPFKITPHTDFFFAGGNRGATLEALMYAVTNDEGIVKVSGEVGSGKTMLCRVLIERLPDTVTIIYLANPSLSRDDILYAIADELRLEIPAQTRSSSVLRSLQDHLIQSYSQGRQVVVLIDEAHAMPADTLEEIRLLSNLESNRNKLLQLVLFGQPELNDVLARPDMRQLKERITHNFTLEPLMRDDIVSYLDFRMRAAGYKGPSVFTAAAIKAISKVSLGLTRRINILADKALLATYSAGTHQVGAQEVNAAIRDSEFSNATQGRVAFGDLRGKWVLPTTAALSFVAGATLLAIFSNGASTTTPTAPATPGVAMVPASPAQVAAGPITTEKTQAPGPIAVMSPALPQPTQASPAETAPPTPTPETPAVQSAPSILVTSTQPESKPIASADPLGPLTRERIEAWRAWMGQVKNDRWFVQLLASDRATAAAIEPFLKKAGAVHLDPEQIRVYVAEVNGSIRYGVIYGEFASRSDASAFIQSLPKSLRSGRPYPRRVSQLR